MKQIKFLIQEIVGTFLMMALFVHLAWLTLTGRGEQVDAMLMGRDEY